MSAEANMFIRWLRRFFCRPFPLLLLPGLLLPAVQAAAPGDSVANLPTTADLRPKFQKWGLPWRTQGERGTCSVFALTGSLEYALASRQQTGTVMSVEFLNWASNRATTNSGDGGFFADLWAGYKSYGICPETSLPYSSKYDANLQPDEAALKQAKKTIEANLQLHWIKPWDVTTGLTDAQFQEIKKTLVRGWPVCGGFRWPKHEAWPGKILQMAPSSGVFDGHSVLLVGFKDDASQPGGGIFLIRNSGGGPHDGAIPYGYVRAYMNDGAWIQPVSEVRP